MSIFRIFITQPLGWILGVIYEWVNNYGWALILFTLLIKIVLIPLGLKQQKSMTRMQMVQPKMTALQEKYKNDQNKLSEETMKLYKEYNVSPMGGCLPLLIQMPILFGLYRVIYQPLTYLLRLSAEEVANLTAGFTGVQAEILAAEANNLVNFMFAGLNLSETPQLMQPSMLWLIPALAAITTYATSQITMWMNKKKKKDEEPAEEKKPARVLNPEAKQQPGDTSNSMMKSMNIFMPLMTLWITFTLPAAMGLYWTVSNVLSLGQTILLNGYYSNKYQAEFDETEQKKLLEKKARHNKKKRG